MTKNSKHTQDPYILMPIPNRGFWIISTDKTSEESPYGAALAWLPNSELISEEEANANARLFAAAPKMYRILKEMYFEPEKSANTWYYQILKIMEDVEGEK